MSAEILRRAASLMRERAEEQRKPHHPYSDKRIPPVTTIAGWSDLVDGYLGGDMGVYCASWHPAVALVVADWLEWEAGEAERFQAQTRTPRQMVNPRALAVARNYLGESA